MNTIKIYKRKGYSVKIEQTKIQRDWMDETFEKHAYKCFPISLANTIGYSISFLEDVEFIWDGICDTTADHVTILKGNKYCHTQRGNATISFDCGLYFKTDEDLSILSIVPPNYFIDGATPFTSIISTSFFNDPYPIAWRITRPNYNIFIPAGMPVATLIPLSLKQLSSTNVELYDKEITNEEKEENIKKTEEWDKISKSGGFTNFYRDAVDYKGNKVGKHELKSLKLFINDFSIKNENDII